jgi:hypothetical protein
LELARFTTREEALAGLDKEAVAAVEESVKRR